MSGAKIFDDGRSYDASMVDFIEKSWIKEQLKNREAEFTEIASGKIFCGTWNINAKKIENESLGGWLRPTAYDYDVFVIGFQEIVDLTAVNVAVDSKSQKQSQHLQEEIEAVLGMKYKNIVSKHLVGLLLLVYAKEALCPFIKDVRCTTAGVGVMGMMGNKGGVSAHFYLYDTAICVVCAHLAAHRENVAGRNADFHNIIEKTIFSADTITIPMQPEQAKHLNSLRQVGLVLPDAAEKSIVQHDIVFWVGDLNYRIDESVPMDDVFNKVADDDLAYLREWDQLNIERRRNNVFEGFDEGELRFPPTYKYQINTDNYDRRPEKKIRAPAWCDRILWKVQTGLRIESVTELSYVRADLRSSDHKPVAASFDCKLRRINVPKQRAVYDEVLTLLNKHNNDSIPRIEVQGQELHMGTVYFQVSERAVVRARNTGSVRAHWRFVPKQGESSVFCRPWLTVTPSYGILLPDETVDITLSLTVTASTAHALNSGCELLTDNLVLRAENGTDSYISVTADYARSCYGMSLLELMCTLQPVRNTKPPVERSAPSPQDRPAPGTGFQPELGVPKELWRLVDQLFREGMEEPDVFVTAGKPDELFLIREALDRGQEFPANCSPLSVATALQQFLSSLSEPLLPPEHYPTVELDEQNERQLSRRFLESLSVPSYNVFVYLMSFFRELLGCSRSNRLTPAKLAAFCVTCMTRSSELNRDEKLRVETVMSYFLTTTAI